MTAKIKLRTQYERFFIAVCSCALIVSAILLGVTLILGPFFFGINMFEKSSCANYSSITGRETQYKFAGGCFVKSDSGWLTKDEYGKVIIAREGLSRQQ